MQTICSSYTFVRELNVVISLCIIYFNWLRCDLRTLFCEFWLCLVCGHTNIPVKIGKNIGHGRPGVMTKFCPSTYLKPKSYTIVKTVFIYCSREFKNNDKSHIFCDDLLLFTFNIVFTQLNFLWLSKTLAFKDIRHLIASPSKWIIPILLLLTTVLKLLLN